MLSVDPAAAAAAAATARAADVAPVAGAVAAAAAAGYTESPMQPPPRCAAAVPSTSSQPPPRAPPSAPHTTTAHGFRSLLPAATPTTLLRKQALLRHMALGSEAVAGSSGGAGATTSGAQPSTSATAASKGTPQTAEEFVRKAPVEPFTGPTSSQGDAATGEKRVAGRLIDWHTPALPKRADQVICFTRTIFSAGDAALARPPDSAAPCTASPSAHAPACLSEPAAGKHTPLWKHSPLFTGDTTIFSPSDFALKQFGVTPLLPARPLTQPALFDTAGPKTSAVPAVPPTAPGASIPAAAVVGPAAVVALAAAPVDSPAMRFAL